MKCTILEYNGHKELYYGEQNHTGLPEGTTPTYELSEAQVEIIRTCTTEEIQSILTLFTQTCPKLS